MKIKTAPNDKFDARNGRTMVHQMFSPLLFLSSFLLECIWSVLLMVIIFYLQWKCKTLFNIFRKDIYIIIWTASSKFGTYRLCEQRRFRRACAFAQSRQNLRCSLIEAVNQEEHSDRKPDPWPLWMAGHAQLKFVMTECSKTQIRLTGLIYGAFIISFRKIVSFSVDMVYFVWIK